RVRRKQMRTSTQAVRFKWVGTKSNKMGIGTRATVRSGKLVQFSEVRAAGSYLSSNDRRLHFGLGAETTITEVEIRWPSSRVEALSNIPADFIYTIVEGGGIKDKAALPALQSASPLLPKVRTLTPSAK